MGVFLKGAQECVGRGMVVRNTQDIVHGRSGIGW